MKLDARCQNIELILSDVDGVLTDGSVTFDNQGIETKSFHIRDGLGIKLWIRSGHRFGLVTSRTSHIVKVRAAELGIEIVRQGFIDKLPTVRDILEAQKIPWDRVCYVGDDLPDLAVIRAVGLGVAVADAVDEVRAAAHFVTSRDGGRGAVREVIELILKAKKCWEDVVRKYS
jgi:YrbI family 3-deoxy-D-manno-octulosonate 8-phosphate phosphatase